MTIETIIEELTELGFDSLSEDLQLGIEELAENEDMDIDELWLDILSGNYILPRFMEQKLITEIEE